MHSVMTCHVITSYDAMFTCTYNTLMQDTLQNVQIVGVLVHAIFTCIIYMSSYLRLILHLTIAYILEKRLTSNGIVLGSFHSYRTKYIYMQLLLLKYHI